MRCLLALSLLAFQPAFADERPHAVPEKHSSNATQVSLAENGQPGESGQRPDGSQLVFDGRVSVSATISLAPSRPQSVLVSLRLTNRDAPPITLDDAKFFLLDGGGRQLRRLSLDEVKYPVEYLVTQISGSGAYPPTPAPPRRGYIIAANPDGSYTLQEMGNGGEAPADPSGYLLGYAGGAPPRQSADRKRVDQILQQAQATLSRWDASYFSSQAPLIPGESRQGTILYWADSAHSAEGPFRLVMFLADPSSGKPGMVKFDFR